jgi:tetratricopeptide (TPR) repeat protein
MRTLFVNVGISLLLIFNSNSFLSAQETTIIPVSSQPRFPTAQSVNKMRTEAKQLLKLGDEKYNNDNELSLYIRTEEAIEYWEKAARIYRETQDFRLEAEVLERLGSAYKLLYQRAKDQLLVGVEDHGNKATSFYRQAFTKYEKIGDFPNQARILRLMGDIYVGLSEYIKASESYDQASNIFATLNDYENEAAALTSLGFAYSILLKYEMATDAYQRALIRFKQIKNYHGEAHVSKDCSRAER